MTRLMTAMCCACVLGVSGIATAQTGTAGKMDKDMMSKEMKVTGCVAQSGGDMGHYMLNNAMMADTAGMKKDSMPMKGDMKAMSYMLMGGDLKAHVGHKVEVTGTMADSKMDAPSKDKMAKDPMAKGMADAQTLTVKSVKMIAATCP